MSGNPAGHHTMDWRRKLVVFDEIKFISSKKSSISISIFDFSVESYLQVVSSLLKVDFCDEMNLISSQKTLATRSFEL